MVFEFTARTCWGLSESKITWFYHTTQAVRGPMTKINQSKCSIAGSIFSKYWTGHRPEWSRTWVFPVFAFFSRVINLLLTNLARDRTGRISALGLSCTDLAALGPYCQDLGPIFSQYSPRAWLISYIYILSFFTWFLSLRSVASLACLRNQLFLISTHSAPLLTSKLHKYKK